MPKKIDRDALDKLINLRRAYLRRRRINKIEILKRHVESSILDLDESFDKSRRDTLWISTISIFSSMANFSTDLNGNLDIKFEFLNASLDKRYLYTFLLFSVVYFGAKFRREHYRERVKNSQAAEKAKISDSENLNYAKILADSLKEESEQFVDQTRAILSKSSNFNRRLSHIQFASDNLVPTVVNARSGLEAVNDKIDGAMAEIQSVYDQIEYMLSKDYFDLSYNNRDHESNINLLRNAFRRATDSVEQLSLSKESLNLKYFIVEMNEKIELSLNFHESDDENIVTFLNDEIDRYLHVTNKAVGTLNSFEELSQRIASYERGHFNIIETLIPYLWMFAAAILLVYELFILIPHPR